MKKHIIVVGLLAVSCVCEAGLFDAVKNVANAVGVGPHCQVTLPSGVQCSNSPVDGSQYCSEHKCSLCNAAAWAGGLCRACDSTKDIRLQAERKLAERKAKAKSELSLVRRQSENERRESVRDEAQRGNRRRMSRSVVRSETDSIVVDPASFAGFKFGMIAPYGKIDKDNRELDKKFLRIFESVKLTYNKNSKLLYQMDFESTPLHGESEEEFQEFIDSVCADAREIYGYELKHKGRFWQEIKGERMVGLGVQSGCTVSDGNKDEYKKLVLTFINTRIRDDKTVVEHPIVPYEARKFLHLASGLIYDFWKEGERLPYGKKYGLNIEAVDESIFRQNNYTVKIPTAFIHGSGLLEEGEHIVKNPIDLLNGIRFKGNRISYDLSEFAADRLADISADISKFAKGIEKVRVSAVAITNEAFVAKLLKERDLEERKKVANFYGCLDEWMECVERPRELAAIVAQKALEEAARKEAEKRQREHDAFVKQYGEQVAWMNKPIATAAELVEWMRSKKNRTKLQVEEDFKELKGKEIIVHGKVNDIGRFPKSSMLYASIRIGRLGAFRDIDMKCIMSEEHVKTARRWDLNTWVTIKGKIGYEADALDRDDLILQECEPVRAEDFSIWCKVNGFTAKQYESGNQRMIEDDLKSAGGMLNDAALLLWGAAVNGSL